MSRVITFSRNYPSYHPKAGQLTYFVEKIWASLFVKGIPEIYFERVKEAFPEIAWSYKNVMPKHHTIRAGHRWKEGDWFSPRVWGNDINPKTGKSGPYHSKQIIIGPDTQIKRTWDFDINGTDFFIDGRHEYALTGEGFDINKVAMNDGLSPEDLYDWFTLSPDFKKNDSFQGQIICWNDSIEY